MILVVYLQEPNWPEDKNRPRFKMIYAGKDCWVETSGETPTDTDLGKHFNPPPVAIDPTQKLEAITGLTVAQIKDVLR